MNTQRRIFRGRGGPTDGRLPKHNARRRRNQKQATKPEGNKYGGQDDDDDPKEEKEEDDDDSSSSTTSSIEILEGGAENSSSIQRTATTSTPSQPVAKEEEEPPPWKGEINHLRKRMRNVQESTQTGTAGIANPKIYQENVLNAVQNRIKEWRAIRKHYEIFIDEPTITTTTPSVIAETVEHHGLVTGTDEEQVATVVAVEAEDDNSQNDDGEGESDSSGEEEEQEEEETLTTPPVANTNLPTASITTTSIDPQVVKETALQVYMLLQLSVQCGPLAGGKPGYFKRCGSSVAKMVEEYLNQVVPNRDDCLVNLAFTTKQADAIELWRKNAHKAAQQQDKQPSKSAIKKQSGKSKKKKKLKK